MPAGWQLIRRVLILDEPTRGIDVGTKAEIQKLVMTLAEEGKAIVFISSELEEVMRCSHRIAVLSDKKKIAEFSGQIDEKTLLETMAGSGCMKNRKSSLILEKFTSSRLFYPLLALVIILILDGIFIPDFFSIQIRNGDLYGRVIDIMRNASTVMVLALGMTLVIATGGIDLSVGAVMAIAASVAAIMMNPVIIGLELPPDLMKFMNDPNFTYSPLWEVIMVTLLVAIICGVWNGVLVAHMKIQPMVGTLILCIAGRGIAQLITNGVRIQIFYQPYAFIGQGWIILPFSLYLAIILFVLIWMLTRKTSIGMFIESVGINPKASFYSGINEKNIKMLVYIICGLCAGIAGLDCQFQY